MKSLEELMDKLKIEKYPERWSAIFQRVYAEYTKRAGIFIGVEYLNLLNSRYQVFKRCFDEILAALNMLNNNPEYVLFAYLIYNAMKNRELFKKELKDMSAPSRQSELYNIALLFSVFPTIPETAKKLRERGIPEEVYYATLAGYEDSMLAYKARYGRIGYDIRYISWIQLYIDACLLRIGRLNFEKRNRFGDYAYVFKNQSEEYMILIANARIHKSGMILNSPGFTDELGSFEATVNETSDYYEGYSVLENNYVSPKQTRLYKTEWKLMLSPDDPVISVHIPAGDKLSAEACEDAYSYARMIYKECYPEFNFKAFSCYSWLMSPQLADLLPNSSNIVSFQNKYLRFPGPSSGKAVLDFVFHNKFTDFNDLPENTSLERILKNYYLSGKCIYEAGGIFF